MMDRKRSIPLFLRTKCWNDRIQRRVGEILSLLYEKLGGKFGYFKYPFPYPTEIRKIIHTTNIIEGSTRQFRQIIKNKPSFTNNDSLRKMLNQASRKIVNTG